MNKKILKKEADQEQKRLKILIQFLNFKAVINFKPRMIINKDWIRVIKIKVQINVQIKLKIKHNAHY